VLLLLRTNKLQQYIQPLLGGEAFVIGSIGLAGLPQALELPNGDLHAIIMFSLVRSVFPCRNVDFPRAGPIS
jgi:hypothetical protein